jgi:hypothetical protein
MVNIFKEPLLHFVLAGGVLFGVHAWLARPAESPEQSMVQQVRIGARDVQWLTENWARQWQRPPTRQELRGLVTDYLNEQLLAREARAVGLDDNDVIVRRRLAQKLTFLIDDTLKLAEPTDSELQQLYNQGSDLYRTDARISFTHIYFSPNRRADARSDAKDTLALLVKAEAVPAASELGDPSLLEREFHDETEQAIAAAFGPDFARTVFSSEPGAWSGPIKSGHGLHLVRVSHVETARLRPFSEVHMRVVEEWQRSQQVMAKERYLAELRKKYDVVVDESVGSLVAPADAPNAKPASPAKGNR